MASSGVTLPTSVEMREMLRRHRFINSPTFAGAVGAANREIQRQADRRKRDAVIEKRLNWNPRAQRQLDRLRAEIRHRMEPYIDRLVRR